MSGAGSQYIEDFFVYELDFTSGIASGASSSSSIQVQADSDFKWLKAAQFTVSSASTADQQYGTWVMPSLSIQITDSGSGRQLFLNSMPLPSIFGNANLPAVLPLPRIFKARSNIAVTLTNFSSVNTYYPRLSFIGTKLFRMN
jgi:hypothetical protein